MEIRRVINNFATLGTRIYHNEIVILDGLNTIVISPDDDIAEIIDFSHEAIAKIKANSKPFNFVGEKYE